MNHMKQSCRGGLGGVRSVTAFIANIAVSLALIAVLPIMVIWPFGGSHRPTVEVHDEAGILRTEPLAKKIQEMRFRQDLHVAVLTVPGWDVTNLNDSVLEYARSHASDTDVPWISTSNPNYWSDGLVILAVAPDSRKVGCYFGEDVAVTLDQQAVAPVVGVRRRDPRDVGVALVRAGVLQYGVVEVVDVPARDCEHGDVDVLTEAHRLDLLGQWLALEHPGLVVDLHAGVMALPEGPDDHDRQYGDEGKAHRDIGDEGRH